MSSQISSSHAFYQNLPTFHSFDDIKDLSHFRQAPDDWVVLVSDIKGSTQASTQGRYKEVNMLGVAVIVLVANKLKDQNVACVFGGDGATLLLPQTVFEGLKPALAGLIALARAQFAMELRVGAVNVGVLRRHGFPLLVGKFQVSVTTALAQFIGAGIAKAEDWIKSAHAEAQLIVDTPAAVEPDLEGLSCRLQPFKSQQGLIVTLIVKPRSNQDSEWLRSALLPAIKEILGGDLRTVNPVARSTLAWKWIPDTLHAETSLAGRRWYSRLKTYVAAIGANVLLKFNLPLGRFHPSRYKDEVPIQSDYKKFDENLRMVVDCTPRQYHQLRALFESGYRAGRLFFGTYTADHAIVTCLTYSASTGHHVHFVDGENCGYTRAAIELKKQIKESFEQHPKTALG